MKKKIVIVSVPGDRIQGTWRVGSEEWLRPDTTDDPTMYKSLIRVLESIGRKKDDSSVIVCAHDTRAPKRMVIAEALKWAKRVDAERRGTPRGHQVGPRTPQQVSECGG